MRSSSPVGGGRESKRDGAVVEQHAFASAGGVVLQVSGDVSGGGVASMSIGGDATTGVHIGDVNLRTGARARTRYRFQVERIAPEVLEDREAELAELAGFCLDPGTSGQYRWWRAGPWAGKSAVMSWFVLHPPPGVRVVSFFVTARLAGQSDRTAFVDNVLEQLLTILGDALPPFLTPATREPHLLGLLDEAARVCHGRGENLVLLVDGLDEDRGVTVGADAHSIAGLLPLKLPAGMRVVVAGRPNPPIPLDVHRDHPLRRPDVVRALEPSPRARVLREEMENELLRLLDGNAAELDLLGLLTAAGGGLTAADLAGLTGREPWWVQRHLRTVAGRSFTSRDSPFAPGIGREVYLLGHEQLQTTAVDMLGSERLKGYRDRIHAWAAEYREQRWPVGTPHYLLQGYHTMLMAIGDLDRATHLCTDSARHDRLLTVSGGDNVESAQIALTLDARLSQDPVDLSAVARLAVHRDHLADRNSHIPLTAPALWARLGRDHHAIALSQSIRDPDRKDAALALLAAAIAETAGEEDAVEAFGVAVRTARSITARRPQGWALMSVAEAMAVAGHRGLAEDVADSISGPYWRGSAFAAIAEALARAGRGAESVAAFGRAVDAAGSITGPYRRSRLLVAVAEAMTRTGRGVEATGVFERGVEAIGSITNPYSQSLSLVEAAEALVKAGRSEQATEMFARAVKATSSVTDGDRRDWAVVNTVAGLTVAGLHEWSADLARSITEPYPRGWALLWAAEGLSGAARDAEAVEALELVDETAHSITDPDQRSLLFASVAKALADIGRGERAAEASARAVEAARCITDFNMQGWALGWVAETLIHAGDQHRAMTVVASITVSERRTWPGHRWRRR